MTVLEVGSEDVVHMSVPGFWSVIYHVFLGSALLAGSKLVLFKGKTFEPGAIELFCEAAGKEKMKSGAVLAAWFLEMAKWPEEKCRQYDLSSLALASWGISAPYPVWKTIYEKFGITAFRPTLGGCEAIAGVCLNYTSSLKLLKEGKGEPLLSFGYPIGTPTMVRLVDDEGNDVGPGEVGEVIIKGPAMAYGYLGEPERWEKRYRDGWYYTGDLFRRDESGYLYMEVKREDVGMCPVDKEGKYVLPYRIQDAVLGMENVVEASLIAVADPEYKAKYRIIVRPVEGVEISADEILETASKAAPDYVIKDVIIRKEPIPKTVSGKILVRALAEEYGGIIPEE